MSIKQKGTLGVITALLVVLLLENVYPVQATTVTLEEMRARAEAIVNYEWTPTQRIDVWNENPYNGKMYFEAGETVKGMPYTLFAWELNVDSLLSLEQYKTKTNYSTTAYCTSVGDNRTGPVYGSCCATFVSEVFGGSFMNGANPRFDGVYTLRNSSYALTTYSVKAVDLQPGDAVSNPDSAHIVWIGDVTDTDFVVYEQTPPVARKILVPKTSVDENGYLTISYDGKAKVFNVVTKSRDAAAPETYELSKTYAAPIKAYTINTGKTLVMDRVGGNAKYNKIYDTDICTIDEIYENGWCHVVFPLDAGGEDDGYVTFDTFLAGAALDTATISCDSTTYARADCMDDFGYVVAGTTVTITEQSGGVIQILYRDLAGDQRLAWIEETAIQQETAIIPGDVTGDGVVNGADLIRLRKYLAAYNNETGACDVEIAPGADVNEDGAVNGKDLIRLRKQLAAME